MTDARIRVLAALALSLAGIAITGCASQPTASTPATAPEPVASVAAELPVPDEPEGTETPPEELEAEAEEVETFLAAAA